ncbi:MAG TPA: glycoside hydrolase family 2 protein [Acholeplasmataceae bacterium]|nr:glycoside hydrolase family 2 protein [Acholeplasmataceae bacterium]
MKLFHNQKKFEIVGFNHFWKFSKKHLDCSYEEALNSLESFQDVVLPHDWLIYQVDDLYESSSGWYYKKFLLNKEATCRYFIRFDGVYMDSTVYLNYQKVGEWKNGYTSFEFEITDFCRDGENIMVVRVLHEHPNSRWYSGAGIYRNVYILKKQENHLLSNGIYLHTNPKTGEVIIETEMNLSKNVVLEHNILREDYLIASTRVSVSKNFNKVKMKVEDKVNWSPANPVLYKLITNLYLDNEIIDGLRTYFGFKDVLMDPNLGFILNGEKQKLNGVCEHHDLGAFGAAFSKITLKKRLKMLKEMGVNAIRCAHSVPAPELMELADEMGFLIVSEAFDMWELSKNPYDYARFFNEWVEKDVESWIKRDRNHVSLLMWSIGNEIYDTHASKRGLELTKMLRDLILKHDPYENGKITICSNFLMGENTQQAADELKLVGYNYLEHLYEKHHKKYPDWVIFGSETASIVQSRGIYHFPLAEQIYYHEDKQCSSLGNSITSWGAKSLESSLTIDRDLKFSLGQFIWTGHDYLGEPTPYDTKNSYFGQIDTAGFPKDAYFVRQASWRKDLPVLHIFPYWNFNEGELIDVRVATNLEKIELFLNDKLVGSKCINVETDQKIIPTWQVPFEKGELKAIAYNKAGEEVARVSKKTFSNPVDFKITVLDQVLKADGVDVSEVVIETIDSEGNLVEDDNQILEVIVTGAGKLLGLDNGDSTDYSPFKGRIKPLFSGKLKAFIGSLYHPGTIHVTIKSQFIKAKEFTLVAVEVPLNFEQELAKKKNHYLRSSIIDNDLTDNELMNQIPVRKIKLRTFTKVLNQDHKQAFIQAKTLPNCAVADMKWSIVTKKGIPTDNAIIKKAENGIILEGVKDGEFVLRGAVCNQKQQAAVISELGFAVSGISPAYKNPFIFISAGLYDDFSGEIKPGNEFGIATSDQELTTVIYQNLNFDKHNSKKITLSIFSFTSEPLEIEVYYQDSEAKAYHYLDKLTYQKETIWNLYQEESYLLPKELTGIVALKLVFGRAVHFKGFYFERKSHRGQLISILDADTYYGDYYTRQDWGFSEIGNNTTFIFNELYFDQEVDEITIEGKANVQDNSIRIQVTDRTGNCETYQVEFLQKSEFSKQCFKIKPLKGNYRVEFIFLPGSNFNFKTFEFS